MHHILPYISLLTLLFSPLSLAVWGQADHVEQSPEGVRAGSVAEVVKDGKAPGGVRDRRESMLWDEFLEYISMQEEWVDEESWLAYLEELEWLHEHPLNVNTASYHELRALPFLTERQIEQIMQYVDFHHGMHSLAELILLTSISYQERQFLPLFLTTESMQEAQASQSKQDASQTQASLSKQSPTQSMQGYSQSKQGPSQSKQGAPQSKDLTQRLFSKEWFSKDRLTQELATRTDIPFYHRRGYLVKNGYRGSHIYNKVYYRLEASKHLSASLRTERDAGERGIDSYGAHIMLSDIPLQRKAKKHTYNASTRTYEASASTHTYDVSTRTYEATARLKTLIVGDFKVAFGQGLVLNQGFSMSKNLSSFKKAQGFRPQRSTEEINYMRGIGSSLTYSNMALSVFYSHRRWDATLDSTNIMHAPTVKTLVKDGYHRTETEYGKKGVLGVNVTGGNLSWNNKALHLGATGYYMKTNKELVPGNTAYRQIYPQGYHFGSVGIDYGYEAYRWHLYGETAYGGTLTGHPQTETGADRPKRNGLATLNGLKWRISQRYTLSLIQRYYNYYYYSFFSSALSEIGAVQNETGGMARIDAQPWDGIQLGAYIDLFYNPWPRYGLKKSSGGWEGMLETQCDLTRRSYISARYNIKRKEQSSGPSIHHRLRLQWTRTSPSGQWRMSTTALLHALPGSYGEAIGCTMKFQNKERQESTKNKWNLSVNGMYFHTTDNDSRIYMYETNVSEMMYIPSFSGHGLRASGMARCQVWQGRLTMELKYGVTRYLDRKTQGSGMQTIYSPVKNDITAQVRLKI